jgi:hypothetical protein
MQPFGAAAEVQLLGNHQEDLDLAPFQRLPPPSTRFATAPS